MNISPPSPLPKRPTIGAVLLAAGAGSRLGYKPKSLLELDGVPLIHRQLKALSGAGVEEIVVVLGHYAAMVEAAVRACPVAAEVETVSNPSPDDGQPSSVPLFNEDDVLALMRAFADRSDAASMVVPRVSGSPGNPVIFDAVLRDEWLRGDTNVMGRGWREANLQRVQWMDTESPHFRVDIDTPEDIVQFTQRTGHTLRWPSE